MTTPAPDPWAHPLTVDMRLVRKASKDEVWFRQNCTFPSLYRWTVGVGKMSFSRPSMEEALAEMLTILHNIAVFEGACD